MELLTFSEYQKATGETAVYPGARTGRNEAVVYLGLKLAGEAGEVAEKIGKFLRDGTSWHDLKDDLEKELGDVLWYITRLGDEFGIPLIRIAGTNKVKLQSRKERGVLQGSGDDR